MTIEPIIGHLVGDYLLQNDWMAGNKKSNNFACAVHCAIWTLCVVAFAGWWTNLLAIAFLFTTHFIQDRTNIIRKYMSFMRQDQFAEGVCKPWSVIIVDNVWHILEIYFVASFLV